MTDVQQRVTIKSWPQLSTDELFDIVVLRTNVYCVEQGINEQDFDELDRDANTLHWWIPDSDGVAAYLRTLELPTPECGAERAFGRMVVRADRRREGLAQQLIAGVVERYGDEPMAIHAQAYVVDLYAGFGFVVVGETHEEAGLPHHMMVRPAD